MSSYTVNHKKRDILFLTITLANFNRFLQLLYHFNREEILRANVIKFITSPDLCAHLTWKNYNLHFCCGSQNVAVCIWLHLCHILTDFNNFCTAETRKNVQNRACSVYTTAQSRTSTSCASDLCVVRTGPVCCEPRHRRVEASSVGLSRLLKADILNITYDCYSQNRNGSTVNLIIGDDLFVLFCCERKWTQNNSVFNWKVLLFKFTK